MRGTLGDGLNSAQRTAVTTLSGPLLVLAGAGTGKTRVITFRIAELIRGGTKPNRILAVTFTNKAAREMKERTSQLLGRKKKGEAGPEVSTFHSLCVRVLRRHARTLGYPEHFSIYDRGDQESLARSALRDVRVGHEKLRPSDLLHKVSGWKSQGITAKEAEGLVSKDTDLLAVMAYGRYEALLRASGAMDFDDLLLNTERLFREHPEARFAEESRFDHLLIDEYQDTNGLQYQIVKALASRHRNLCVVGDDDQSIYGFRGAEVEHILHFKSDWPDAKVVRLEDNYRCTEWIIHLANNLIAHNKARHDKVLRAARGRGVAPRFLAFEDEESEADAIAAEIHGKINRQDDERIPASHIAILFRTNEQPRAFEQALRRAGIPYVLVGGQSFFDRKEIKDLLSYLRVLANPLDEVSLLRIINTPARGIGTSSIEALLKKAVEEGAPLMKVLPDAPKIASVSQPAANAIGEFLALLDEFRARSRRELLSQWFPEFLARVNYKAEIERQYKDPSEQETRWNTVEQLLNSIVTYENRSESPSLIGFVEETTLMSQGDDDDDDKRREHSVTLMTLHSAKGLEFPEVYLVGMEEGILPHKRSVIEQISHGSSAIDEERRLAYVGVTRAQNVLTLSYAKGRMKWGKLRNQLPSRFLLEMRGQTDKSQEIAQLAVEQLSREIERAEAKAETEPKGKGKGKKSASPRKKSGDEGPSDAPVQAVRRKKFDSNGQKVPSVTARPAPPPVPPPAPPKAASSESAAVSPPSPVAPPSAVSPAIPSAPLAPGATPEIAPPVAPPAPPIASAVPAAPVTPPAASSATPPAASSVAPPTAPSVAPPAAAAPPATPPAAAAPPIMPPAAAPPIISAPAPAVERPAPAPSHPRRPDPPRFVQVSLFGDLEPPRK